MNRNRKNYFDSSRVQKYKYKKQLRNNIIDLNIFAQRIGLQVEHVIFRPNINIIAQNNEERKIDITVLPNSLTAKQKVYKCLIAKDLSNLSNRNYSTFRKTLKDSFPFGTSLDRIRNLQKDLNRYFWVKSNAFGFYLDPKKKFQFVISKFLEKNVSTHQRFSIKLSADSSTISKTKINLLLFTFELLNDTSISSVNTTYILGKFLILVKNFL